MKNKRIGRLMIVLGVILSMFIQPLSPVMGQLYNYNNILTTSDIEEEHTEDLTEQDDQFEYYDLDWSEDDLDYIDNTLNQEGWVYIDGFILMNSQGNQMPQGRNASGQIRARVNRMSNATYWTRHINIPGVFYGTHPETNTPRNPWGFEHWQAYIPSRGWITAFCTQPGVPSVWAGDQEGGWTPNSPIGSAWDNFSIAQQVTIEYILMFGYGNFHGVSGSPTNDDSIIATQVAITEVALGLWTVDTSWKSWDNRNNPSSTAWHFNERLIRTTGIASGSNEIRWNAFQGTYLNHTLPIGNQSRIDRYDAIRQDINNLARLGLVPQFSSHTQSSAQQNTNIHTLTWNNTNQRYQVTLSDTATDGGNEILHRFITLNIGQSTTFDSYTVERTGTNTIIVHTTNPNATRTTSPASLMRVVPPNEIPLVWWHHPNMQDKVTGNFVDPLTAFFAVEVEAIGNLEIIKYSETGARIPNTEFRVVGNDIDTVITTNANGIATLNNIPTGVYTITEVSVPSPYLLDPTPRTVTVAPNTNQVVTNTVTFTNERIRGGVEVPKIDRERNLNVPQGEATLQGAEIAIINRSAEPVLTLDGRSILYGEIIGTIITGVDGIARTSHDYLQGGAYELREIRAPRGYIINSEWSYTFTISEQHVIVETTETLPQQIIRGGVEIEKADRELTILERLGDWTGLRPVQGDASLVGIQFDIINVSTAGVGGDGSVIVNDQLFEVGDVVKTIFTDYEVRNGQIHVFARTEIDSLPFGTFTIQEIAANNSYLLTDGEVRTFEIRENHVIVTGTIDDDDLLFLNYVVRGDVEIEKWDIELDASEAMIGTSLEGIEFEIINESSNPVLVDGNVFAPSEVIMSIFLFWCEDAEAYVARTTGRTFPYGTYEITEIRGNTYYLLEEEINRPPLSFTFEIREDGTTTRHDLNNNEMIFKNQIRRGDISGVKIAELTAERLSNIPFAITNHASGEINVIVTDTNGEFSTHHLWNPRHYANINNHVLEIEANGDLIMNDDLNMYGSVWFGLGEFGTAAPVHNTLGALPYGRYTVRELRAENNVGFELLEFDIFVTRHGHVIDLGTLTNINEPQPEFRIATQAHIGDNETQNFLVGESFTAHDNIRITHTDVPEGTLMSFRAFLWERMLDGSARLIFYTDYQDYTVENVEELFTIESELIDSNELEGEYLFWSETLYLKTIEEDEVERELVYEHNKDGSDTSQKLHPRQPEPTPERPTVPNVPSRPNRPSLPQTGSTAMNVLLYGGIPLVLGGVATAIKFRIAKKKRGECSSGKPLYEVVEERNELHK